MANHRLGVSRQYPLEVLEDGCSKVSFWFGTNRDRFSEKMEKRYS